MTETRALTFAYNLAEIRDGTNVLEVAVGTGRFFEWLIRANPNGLTAGVEISANMIQSSLKRLHALNNRRGYLVQGDIRQLPVGLTEWDRIIGNYVFDLLSPGEIISILNYIKRLLHPEGRVITTTMAAGYRWYHQAWSKIADIFPWLLTYCRPTSMAEYLRETGFNVEQRTLISQNSFPSEVIYATHIREHNSKN